MKRPFNRALRGVLVASLLILIAWQGQSQPILDLLSTSPSVAYSLRQLKSSATRAIQVRRSSDGLTMDIGFTAGGDLDQVALLSFVGSDNGYISIWYDQSGNGHDAIQATAAKQPRIVNAGVVDVQNGRPICDFDGSASTMATLRKAWPEIDGAPPASGSPWLSASSRFGISLRPRPAATPA